MYIFKEIGYFRKLNLKLIPRLISSKLNASESSEIDLNLMFCALKLTSHYKIFLNSDPVHITHRLILLFH